MQVKVKNSCELNRYVSQNIRTIRSNSWNCTVNKFGVLANLYSARLFCIHCSLKGRDHGYVHARCLSLQNKFVGSTLNS